MEKEKIKTKIFKIVFYSWFIISLILMFRCALLQSGYKFLLIFGQYFLVLGLIITINLIKLKEEKKSMFIPLLLVVLGLIMIIISILGLIKAKLPNGLTMDSLIVFIALFGFILVGIGLCIYAIINYKNNIIKNTVKVEASIDYNLNNLIEDSVLNYTYNNKEYSVFMEDDDLVEIGINKYEIEIDPNNPSHVVSKSRKNYTMSMNINGKKIVTATNNVDIKNKSIVMLIMGLGAIILCSFSLYLFIKYTL